MEDTWKDVLTKKSFWTDYFWITEPYKGNYSWLSSPYEEDRTYPELEHEIRFEVGKTFELGLELDEDLSYSSLLLYHESDPNGIELGFVDGHGFCPYVFRWREIEKLHLLFSKQVPECPNAPFILLSLFSIITTEEEQMMAKEQLAEAWRSLHMFSHEEIDVILQKHCYVHKDKSWVYDENFGWYLDGEDGLTRRHPEAEDFPVDLFQAFLQEVDQ